jgi:hypothetical protein
MTPDELLDYIKEFRKSDQENIKSAHASMEKRLESINEFRGQLKDQAAGFATREEMNIKYNALEARLRGVERLIAFAGGGVAVIQIILHFIK